MGVFSSPGLADEDAPDAIIEAWNTRIADEIARRKPSPFLKLDPTDISGGKVSTAVKWPGHPLEPADCLGETIAEKLSDWGWLGRAELHNEYLEYMLVMRPDTGGTLRPKRFVATTELMEWWQIMAIHDLQFFLGKIKTITGRVYTSEELFGVDSATWGVLPKEVRRNLFVQRIAGQGRDAPPTHSLNQDHALFMSHPINGLDDLIYIVHFGSFAYAVQENGVRRRARIEEIFLNAGAEYLFCRNADPGAAAGAYSQVFLNQPGTPRAKEIAFGDPVGMYIRTFSHNDLLHSGVAIPESWIRFSRGDHNGTPQRLEFGPADDEPAFLDEITLGSGNDAPVVNGYQLAKRIEVGPLVMIAENAREISDEEFVDVPATAPGAISCGLEDNDRCKDIAKFFDLYQANRSLVLGTRGGSRG